jgi:hypothetical protein
VEREACYAGVYTNMLTVAKRFYNTVILVTAQNQLYGRKAVRLQAEIGPEGCRKLRLQEVEVVGG